MNVQSWIRSLLVLVSCAAFAAIGGSASADPGVNFRDFAADPASGVQFSHAEAPRNAILDNLKAQPFVFPFFLPFVPHKPHGAPGVALLDFDGDGDLDVYVTNSFGAANGLFSNQLRESGTFAFIDIAAQAGVEAVDHDSSGVCYGDLDNDGDADLLVLGAIMPNRLYENQGDGTFQDITAHAGVGGGNLSTSSCSMGDVDGDGLLDIAVANTHTTWENIFGIVVPYTFNEHNQLFRNVGGNIFEDVSAASGFETLAGFPPFAAGAASLTWAVAMVDFDRDGDVDILTLDDQGGVPPPELDPANGVNYGLIHLHVNDGSGQFVDRTVEAGLALPGSWMGISFGDFDCNGHLDFFGSNFGDYPPGGQPPNFPIGFNTSRWLLNNGDGTFADLGVGALGSAPFGWGTSAFDYDNDGDTDIVYHGAIDLGFVVDAGNPGTLLRNEGCTGAFTYDADALGPDASDYTRRLGQGLAAGDLNEDGFVDIVSVAAARIPDSIPLQLRNFPTGSPFDTTAFFVDIFSPDPNAPPSFPFFLFWNGNEVVHGDVAFEISSADNGNDAMAVDLLGTVGMTTDGRVNRDGIGAVVTFTPQGGNTQMAPVVGGSSYASQDSLTAHFGMADADKGVVEVHWPGGARNRLRGVGPGERVLFPEIPCDLDAAFDDRDAYIFCVQQALDELLAAGVVDNAARARFLSSMLAAD